MNIKDVHDGVGAEFNCPGMRDALQCVILLPAESLEGWLFDMQYTMCIKPERSMSCRSEASQDTKSPGSVPLSCLILQSLFLCIIMAAELSLTSEMVLSCAPRKWESPPTTSQPAVS